MAESEGSDPKSALATLIEGGLPQIVAGPAGKAISRLVGAAVEIPAAWLEQRAQRIRDETQARSDLMETLAKGSADLGLSDPALLDRGLKSLLGKAYREQSNREGVGAKTIELLAESTEQLTGPGPSDDWMDIFSDHAAKASSESMRDLFSRVLAGEIRKPGNFSLATMQFISVLDGSVAKLIEQTVPYVWNGGVLKEAIAGRVLYGQLLILEEIGFLNLGAGMISDKRKLNEQNQIVFLQQKHALVVEFASGGPDSCQIPSYPLSRTGKELLSVLSFDPAYEESIHALWKLSPKPEKINYGTAISLGDGQVSVSIGPSVPKPPK